MKTTQTYKICDNLIGISEIHDNSIDLTVTSPPYDNLRTYGGHDFKFESLAKELFRVTKEGGVVVWIVGDATENGSESGTSFKQALFFKDVGFNLHDTMIYKKINPIPLTHNRYEQAFEFMFVFTKGNLITFNPLTLYCKTKGSYTHRRNTSRVLEAATRNRDEVTTTKKNKYKSNIWEYVVGSMPGETGNHPAPFPLSLVIDHILSWSNEGDVVFDPFLGSGTTLKACMELNRNCIGFEINNNYEPIIRKRLELDNTKLDAWADRVLVGCE